jgi:hypothetical protein
MFEVPVLFNNHANDYNIIDDIFNKIICINSEIDYFVPLIMQKMKTMYESGGFTESKVYKIYLCNSEITIYDLHNRNAPVEEFWIYRDLITKYLHNELMKKVKIIE